MRVWATLIVFATAGAAAAWSPPAAALEDGATPGRYVYVPNRASADIAVIDTATDRVVARVSVGKVPHQVVVSSALNKLVQQHLRQHDLDRRPRDA